MRRLLLIVALLLWAVPAYGATYTVCASGCTYPNTGFQTALNAAATDTDAMTTILLQEGTTYVGDFVMRMKPCPSGYCVTIKTGVTSTGTLLSDATWPAANVRFNPDTHTTALAAMATIIPANRNESALRTVYPSQFGNGCTSPAKCVTEGYILQFLRFRSHVDSGGALIALGSNFTSGGVPSGDTQNTLAEQPKRFLLDRIYVHGDPVTGQRQCVFVGARFVTIRDSTIRDCKAKGSEVQAITAVNTMGDLTITNNHLQGAGENFIAGGDDARSNYTATVSSGDSDSFVLTTALPDYVQVGDVMAVKVGGTKREAIIATIDGPRTGVTYSDIGGIPDTTAGGVTGSIVPKNLVFTYNKVDKPIEWRSPIVATPAAPTSATGSITGGSLTAGQYCYKLVVVIKVEWPELAASPASTEVCGTVDSGSIGSVTISWAAVTGAFEYRVYGRNSNVQDRYFATASTSVIDTGQTGTLGTPPTFNFTNFTGTASRVVVKNILELKCWDGALIEGNYFAYSWVQGQTGNAITLTPVNQGGSNDSCIVANVAVRYNHIQFATGVFAITGRNADSTGRFSGRGHAIQIEHNLADNINNTWGANMRTFHLSTGHIPSRQLPYGVTVDHNTFDQTSGNAFLLFSAGGSMNQGAEDFRFTNNIVRKLDGGMFGSEPNSTDGANTWTTYVEPFGTNEACSNNVIVGASAANYGFCAGSLFPDATEMEGAFVTYPTNYRVDQGCGAASDTCYDNAATDGTDIGADIDAIEARMAIATSGDNSGTGLSGTLATALAAVMLVSTGTVELSGSAVPVIYNWTKQALLDGTIGLTTRTLKVTLVTNTYTFDPDHTFLDMGGASDPIDARLTGITDQTLSNRSIGLDSTGNFAYLNGDDVTFVSVPTGQTIAGLIIYDDTGTPTTSRLVAYVGLAHTTTGASVRIEWTSPVSGGILNIRPPESQESVLRFRPRLQPFKPSPHWTDRKAA